MHSNEDFPVGCVEDFQAGLKGGDRLERDYRVAGDGELDTRAVQD